MAFTTIAWDGVGVIANCDALADSAGGSWAELGGGGISANPDTYLTPPASIGHVYAAKSGFGYYTAPATYDFTPTTGAQDGQFIYIWIQIASASAFDTLANNGFSFVVGTDTSNYRTFKLAGSGAGEGALFDGGGWKLFVIDPTISGSIADVGTFNLATINMVGLWMDTIVSVRADTIFIDQISIGKGLRVTGTGTVQEVVDYCSDYANRAWGVFQKRGTIGFAYGGLTVGDNASATVNTALTDGGNVVEFGFTEFWNGTAWALTHPPDYNRISLEKHASYTTSYTSTNTSLYGTDGAELSISTESGATLSQTGGQLKEMVALTTVAGEILKEKVISAVDTSSISNTPEACTWDTCGLITLEVGGALDACAINTSTGAVSVLSDALGNVGVSSFISSGANHAVELSTYGASQTWEATTTGYAVGVTGSPITPTSTGNEDIYINLTSALDTTINVAAGASTPSVRAATGFTGNVNVVAGAVVLKMIVKDQAGAFVVSAFTYIDNDNASPFILNSSTDVNGEASVSYSDGAVTGTTWRVRKYGYKPFVQTVDIAGTDITLPVTLITDPQQT